MQNLEGLYEDIKIYNELFKAKTYSDAVEEFYKKNYSIFNELNVMAQKVSEGIENIYAPKEEEKEKSIIHKAVFSDRKKDDLIPSDREKLSDEMTERLDEIAVEYVNAAAEVLYVNGKRPKGRKAVDLNLYMVMYVFPGIVAAGGQFSYEIAEAIGRKWPDKFDSNVLRCTDYDTINSGFRRKFCYITTAVCESLGKGDDCEELNTLRAFRDGYMLTSKDGEMMVEDYYETAPGIVNYINALDNSDDIYRGLYTDYIRPCIDMINDGRLNDCMEHYKKMVESFNVAESFVCQGDTLC